MGLDPDGRDRAFRAGPATLIDKVVANMWYMPAAAAGWPVQPTDR